jgi:hypothetical protein
LDRRFQPIRRGVIGPTRASALAREIIVICVTDLRDEP